MGNESQMTLYCLTENNLLDLIKDARDNIVDSDHQTFAGDASYLRTRMGMSIRR